VITLVWSIVDQEPIAIVLSAMGVMLGHAPRAIAAKRLRQPLVGVLCHSLATLIFVALQWVALMNHVIGRKFAWRGRTET
jgi:hypothetical protein